MSMRSSIRAIAKARLKAMEVPHVNKVLCLGMCHTQAQNLQRTSHGRKMLLKIQKQHQPLWRRVTSGKLASEGYNVQMGIGRHRRSRARGFMKKRTLNYMKV